MSVILRVDLGVFTAQKSTQPMNSKYPEWLIIKIVTIPRLWSTYLAYNFCVNLFIFAEEPHAFMNILGHIGLILKSEDLQWHFSCRHFSGSALLSLRRHSIKILLVKRWVHWTPPNSTQEDSKIVISAMVPSGYLSVRFLSSLGCWHAVID